MPYNKIRVLCPNGRRQVVQIDANTSILYIRETVCQKQDFDPDAHELKFHKRILNDSSTIRFESIPNNAELELIKCTRPRLPSAQTKVTIMLQTEDGQRSSKEFSHTDSLWDVVTAFGRGTCEEDKHPSCRYLMKSVTGQEQLQSTALRKLGLTEGRVCIRYMEVPVDRPTQQAHVVSLDLSKKKNAEVPSQSIQEQNQTCEKPATETKTAVGETENKAAKTKAAVDETENKAAETKNESVEPMDVDQDKESSAFKNSVPEDIEIKVEVDSKKDIEVNHSVITENKQRDDSVFENHNAKGAERQILRRVTEEEPPYQRTESMSCDNGASAAEDINIEFLDDNGSVLLDPSLSTQSYLRWDPPDEFFEFTVADAQLYQQRLREQAMCESTLMLRGKSHSASVSKKYSLCIVRIHLPPPDEYLLQSTFLPTDTIGEVVSFARAYLSNENLDYYIFTTPPKQILNPHSTLEENHLTPSCVVHLGFPRSAGTPQSLIKDSIRSKAVSVEAYSKKMGRKEYEMESGEDFRSRRASSASEYSGTAVSSTSRRISHYNRPPLTQDSNLPKWLKLGKK